jgi:hypothetical protein
MHWHAICSTNSVRGKELEMTASRILDSSFNINALSDESGKRYFNLKVHFSDDDILTVYRNSVEELLEDLPQVLVSAIRARIIQDQTNC